MTFSRPELLALAPLAVLVVALGVTGQWRRSVRLLDALGGRAPAGRLAPRDLQAFPAWRLAALVVAGIALTVAAADPVAGPEPPVSPRPIDLVVAVDLSLSMSARDVGTSRSERAAQVLDLLAEALPREQIGVEVFADWPYTLVPLTHDLDVVRFFGRTVGPTLVPDRDQGTGLGAVVTHARATLEARHREDAEPAILVVTDGESYVDAVSVLDSVALATRDGVRLWTAGVGTRTGAPVPDPGAPGDVLVDETGAPIVTRLDEDLLRQMAGVGGGSYYDVSRDGGVRALLADIAGDARTAPDAHEPLRPALWLTLLALGLMLFEARADGPRRDGRPDPEEEQA